MCLFIVCSGMSMLSQEVITSDQEQLDRKPQFPGCEDDGQSEKLLNDCSHKKLFTYLIKYIEYPQAARESGISGKPVIQFVVNQEGLVENIQVSQSAEASLDESAKSAVEMMIKDQIRWSPGIKNGKPVNVQLKIPIKYKI